MSGKMTERGQCMLKPQFLVKGTLKMSAYQDILNNFILPPLWEQFGDGPF
ncbi:unnamed protein product, partial [Staurois parvus]